MAGVLVLSETQIGKDCEIVSFILYPEIVREDRGLGHNEGHGGKAAKNIP